MFSSDLLVETKYYLSAFINHNGKGISRLHGDMVTSDNVNAIQVSATVVIECNQGDSVYVYADMAYTFCLGYSHVFSGALLMPL